MYLLSGQGQIECLKEVYHFLKFCLRSFAFGITDNKESACPDCEWKVWIKFPASTMVTKSALRNCQDRSFAEFNMMIHEQSLWNSYSAYTIMRVFVNDPMCWKVLRLLQTVIKVCKINYDRNHICVHFKTREISPSGWFESRKINTLVSGCTRRPIKCDKRYSKRSVFIRKYTATFAHAYQSICRK